MKMTQILIIFILISGFAFGISGQEKNKIDTSDEALLSLKEKLKKIKLLVSTEKDVRKVFGKKNCKRWNYCYSKDGWSLTIQYVQSWIGKPRSKEFIGKIWAIVLHTPNVTLSESFISNEKLKCTKTITYFMLNDKSNTRICTDEQGLVYWVYDEFMRNGKLNKNALFSIHYFLTPEKYNEVFIVDEQ
jgi:hypothetical protein